MTPTELAVLEYLATSRVLMNRHLASLVDTNERQVRRHTNHLESLGLIAHIQHLSKSALARYYPPGTDFRRGSIPKIFQLTSKGVRLAEELGFRASAPKAYGEHALSLSHDLLAQDVRVWLAQSSRKHGHAIEGWWTEPDSYVKGEGARPDARFVYRIDKALVAFVEADRKSERRPVWDGKVAAYTGLLNDPERMKTATGYTRGWVLGVTESAERRDELARWVEHPRFAFACFADLQDDIFAPTWRMHGSDVLRPLVPSVK